MDNETPAPPGFFYGYGVVRIYAPGSPHYIEHDSPEYVPPSEHEPLIDRNCVLVGGGHWSYDRALYSLEKYKENAVKHGGMEGVTFHIAKRLFSPWEIHVDDAFED